MTHPPQPSSPPAAEKRDQADDLHQRIMNIQVSDEHGCDTNYQLGHRDARHAAAELALTVVTPLVAAHRQEVAELVNAAEDLRDKLRGYLSDGDVGYEDSREIKRLDKAIAALHVTEAGPAACEHPHGTVAGNNPPAGSASAATDATVGQRLAILLERANLLVEDYSSRAMMLLSVAKLIDGEILAAGAAVAPNKRGSSAASVATHKFQPTSDDPLQCRICGESVANTIHGDPLGVASVVADGGKAILDAAIDRITGEFLTAYELDELQLTQQEISRYFKSGLENLKVLATAREQTAERCLEIFDDCTSRTGKSWERAIRDEFLSAPPAKEQK